MTQYQKFLAAVCCWLFITGAITLSFLIGRTRGYAKGYDAAFALPHKLDTVYVNDTSHHEKPMPSDVVPAGFELVRVGTVAQLKRIIATLEVAASEASEKQDTALVSLPPADSVEVGLPLPIERKVYEGEEYRAVVSGISPKLESLDIYRKTGYITNTITQMETPRRKARVGIGVTAGPGVYWNGSGIQPGVGTTVGLTFTF